MIEKPPTPSGGSSKTSTRSTTAPRGPSRQKRIIDSTASGAPSKAASTAPSSRLRIQPATARDSAIRRAVSRKKTPWTRPWTITRRRIGLFVVFVVVVAGGLCREAAAVELVRGDRGRLHRAQGQRLGAVVGNRVLGGGRDQHQVASLEALRVSGR